MLFFYIKHSFLKKISCALNNFDGRIGKDGYLNAKTMYVRLEVDVD